MRIGLVSGEYPPMQGGIGAHCRVLAQTLTAQGHDVFIFSDERAASDDPRVPLTVKEGLWRGATLRAVEAWAQREQLDVVNLHYQTAAFNMSPWLHFISRYVKSAPLVTTFHDLRFPYLFPKAGPLRTWIVKHLARTSHGVIATNHEDAAQLTFHKHHALIPIGSSVRVSLPTPYDRAAWRSKVGASEADILLAHFGFINHSKGVDTLLDAFSRLLDSGLALRLLMIGGRTGTSDPTNTAYADKIDAKITALGLAERIHWTGFVDDETASAYFAASDAVVLPFRDGASYRRSSLMAVIQHECPIVTTLPSVPINTFKNGANLLMVTPENTPALTAALQLIARDSTVRDRLRAGVHDLKQVFDWDIITRANVAFFERVVTDWRASPPARTRS